MTSALLLLCRSFRPCQQPLDELLVGAEIRLSKAIQGETKVCEAMLRGIGEHAQRAQDDELPLLCFAPAVTIVHQECIGRQFLSESNGLALDRKSVV